MTYMNASDQREMPTAQAYNFGFEEGYKAAEQRAATAEQTVRALSQQADALREQVKRLEVLWLRGQEAEGRAARLSEALQTLVDCIHAQREVAYRSAGYFITTMAINEALSVAQAALAAADGTGVER